MSEKKMGLNILVALVSAHHTSTIMLCNTITYINLGLSVSHYPFEYFCGSLNKTVYCEMSNGFISLLYSVSQTHLQNCTVTMQFAVALL